MGMAGHLASQPISVKNQRRLIYIYIYIVTPSIDRNDFQYMLRLCGLTFLSIRGSLPDMFVHCFVA